MRYAKGHSGLACQTCHESIHGLNPVTPGIDQTTYTQAAALNPDGSHGPIICAACHREVNDNGVPLLAAEELYQGRKIGEDYELAVQYMHRIGQDQGGAGGTPVAADGAPAEGE